MNTFKLNTICMISLSMALASCATTGGFEPARVATTSFSDGAKVGKSFVEARNAALQDAARLSIMQWHTAIAKPGSTRSDNDSRLLQPGDRLDADPGEMNRLVSGIVCDGSLVSDEGTLLIQLSQSAAKSLQAYDFKPSKTTLGNLALLNEKPSPAAISLSTTDNEAKIITAQQNRISACEDDFNTALKQVTKSLPGGGSESVGTLFAAGSAAYSALKSLDEKLAGLLGTVVDRKRRAEFNKFVKENESSFIELRNKLRNYANNTDSADQDAIRLAAMTKYIFTFDDFAQTIVKRKTNSAGSLFAMDMADLSENKKALSVIKTANAYNSAVNSSPAKPIRELAGSIDDLLALTNPPTYKDLYKQYESAKAFYEALGELADATQDDDLKKSLNDLFDEL